MDVSEGLFRFGKEGSVVRQHHYLGKIAHADIALQGHSTGSRVLFAGNNLEHRRLPCTVLSHQRDAVALVYHKAGIAEKGTCRKFNGKMFDGYHLLF